MPTQSQRVKSPKSKLIKTQGLSSKQLQSKISSSKQKYIKEQKSKKQVSPFYIPEKKYHKTDQPSQLVKEIRKTFEDKINQLTKKYFKHNTGQNQSSSSLQNLQTSQLLVDFEQNEQSVVEKKKYPGKKQGKQEFTLNYGSILRIYESGKAQQRSLSKKLQSISRIYDQYQDLLNQKFQSIINDIELIQSKALYFLEEQKQRHLNQSEIQEQIYDFILTLKKVKKFHLKKQNLIIQEDHQHLCKFSNESDLMKVLILNERGSQLMRSVKKIQDDLETKYMRVDKSVGMMVNLLREFKARELFLEDFCEVGRVQDQYKGQEKVVINNNVKGQITPNESINTNKLQRVALSLQKPIERKDQHSPKEEKQEDESKYNNKDSQEIKSLPQNESEDVLISKEIDKMIDERMGKVTKQVASNDQEGKVVNHIDDTIGENEDGENIIMQLKNEEKSSSPKSSQQKQLYASLQGEINNNEQQIHGEQNNKVVQEGISVNEKQLVFHNQAISIKISNDYVLQQEQKSKTNFVTEAQNNSSGHQSNNYDEKQAIIINHHNIESDNSIVQRVSLSGKENGLTAVIVNTSHNLFNEQILQQHHYPIPSQLQVTPFKELLQASPIRLLSSKRSIKNLSSVLKSNIHHINFTQTQTQSQRHTNNLIPQPSSSKTNPLLAINQSQNLQHPKANPYSLFYKSIEKITQQINLAQTEQTSTNHFQHSSQPSHQIQQINQETTFRNYRSAQYLPPYLQQIKDSTQQNPNQFKNMSTTSNTQIIQNPYTINLRHNSQNSKQSLNRQLSMNELSSSRNNAKNVCFGKLREQKLKFEKIKTTNYLIMK